MSSELSFPGNIEKGVFYPADPYSHSMAMASLEGPAIVEYKRFRNTRSDQQNRAWFGIVVKIYAKCSGELNHEAAHYELLGKIHYELTQDMKGRLRRKVKKSRNLLTTEFNELYERAQIFISQEYGVYVPDPDPDYCKWKRERKREMVAA